MVVRVLVADDHAGVRGTLCHLLGRDPQVQVIAEAEDGEVAARLALELRPDVALIDISMPRVNGLEATRRIVGGGGGGGRTGGGHGEAAPAARVIALSLHAEWRMVVEALQAGAAGYLLKTGVARELNVAVRCVAAGELYLSDGIVRAVVQDELAGREGRAALIETLSDAERHALDALCRSFARPCDGDRTAGGRSTILSETLGQHRRGIMQKLALPTVAELMQFALQHQQRRGALSFEKFGG